MIIYFVDRSLNVLGSASTSLPEGLQIVDDSTVEDVESGVNTFSCSIPLGNLSPGELKHMVRTGAFVLKSSARIADDRETDYDALYQIVETEYDTLNREMRIYAEDAGLDLLGKVCGAVKLTDKTIRQMVSYFAPAGWTINTPNISGTKTYEWTGESTATERLRSVARLWDCEIYYSFQIENLTVRKRSINIVKKRGLTQALHRLYLDREVNSITTKSSIADLATAYSVVGGTPSGAKSPINLKGYSYSYTDPKTGDVYQVHSATGQMRNVSAMKRWSSVLDTDGLIVKPFAYETTSKATLAGQARAALQNASQEYVTYEVDVVDLPPDVQVGDRIYIIDNEDALYLDARLLQLTTSASRKTQTATLGEFLKKESTVSEVVRQALMDAQNATTTVINIKSEQDEGGYRLSAEILSGANLVKTAEDLESVFGPDAVLRWYKDDEYIGEGISITIENLGSIRSVYRCDLEVIDE